MLLDITVPAAARRAAAYVTDPETCDARCDAYPDPLSGHHLAGLVLDLTVSAVPGAGWEAIDPAAALQLRGAVLQHRSGRLAVSVGRSVCLEPFGRSYALVESRPERWVAAWRVPSVTYTMSGVN